MTTAFKLVEIPVTEEMIEEEENVIKLSKNNYNFHQLQTAIQHWQNNFNNNGLSESMRRISELTQSLNNTNFLIDKNKEDDGE